MNHKVLNKYAVWLLTTQALVCFALALFGEVKGSRISDFLIYGSQLIGLASIAYFQLKESDK